jgi:hypothetical protein
VIETYAFLAMFTIQILVGSVLSPAWLIARVRAKVASSAGRFAEMFPGVDHKLSVERFATRHRALNGVIAALGLALLGWLFFHLQRPEWNRQKVPLLLTAYLLVQMSPLVFISVKAARFNRSFRSSMADGKRRAVLQRRRLFDFVSPLTVVLAALSYVVFAALVFYIRRHPFPGFGGLTNLAVITPVYALNALLVYGCLYGTNRNPVATHADRLYAMGVYVKICVYTCIAVSALASLTLTLSMLHLRNWELFALSVFFVATTLICSLGVMPRFRPEDTRGSDGTVPPGAQGVSA